MAEKDELQESSNDELKPISRIDLAKQRLLEVVLPFVSIFLLVAALKDGHLSLAVIIGILWGGIELVRRKKLSIALFVIVFCIALGFLWHF